MKKKINIIRKKISEHPFDINGGKTIYIKDSKFMEFVDEMATQITEERFGEEMYESKDSTDTSFGLREEAQDFYNERYDEIETMVNNLMGVYRWSTLPINIFGMPSKNSKDKKSS